MTKTILVADDQKEEVVDLIKRLKSRYTVEYVSNGKAAIERIQAGGLDGAILDWDMSCGGSSKYDGDKVAKDARQLYPGLVLVLRSAHAHKFSYELKPLGIYCHSKMFGDDKLLTYLQEKLGE